MVRVGLTNGKPNSDLIVHLETMPKVGEKLTFTQEQVLWSFQKDPQGDRSLLVIGLCGGIAEYNGEPLKWFKVQGIQ